MSVTLVQVWNATLHSASLGTHSISAASPSPVTAGNTVIVMLGTCAEFFVSAQPNPGIGAPSDGGDTFSSIVAKSTTVGDATPTAIEMFQALAVAGGSITVSVSVTNTRDINMVCAEITPGSAQNSNANLAELDPQTTIATGAISTTAGDYVAAFAYDVFDAHTWTVDSGAAMESTAQNVTAGTTLGFADLASPGGSVDLTFTSPITSINNIPMMAAIANFAGAAVAANRNRAYIV